jgi:hypothetical protein
VRRRGVVEEPRRRGVVEEPRVTIRVLWDAKGFDVGGMGRAKKLEHCGRH